MASTDLILINTTKKNGVASVAAISVDVRDITGPIMPDATTGNLIVMVRNSFANPGMGGTTNVDTYEVSDLAAAITAQNIDLVAITVTERNASNRRRTYSPAVSWIFYLPNMVGEIRPTSPVGGAIFQYHEFGNPTAVEYTTNITPAALVAALVPAGNIGGGTTSPFYPYSSAINTLSDGDLRHEADGVSLVTGKVFRAEIAGGAHIDFGPAGDYFAFTTDGGGFLMPYMTIGQAQIELASLGTGGILMDVTAIRISHADLVQVESGTVRMDINGSSSDVRITTDAGVGAEGFLYLSTTNAILLWGPTTFVDVSITTIQITNPSDVTINTPKTTINSPLIIVPDNSNIDTIGINETMLIGAANTDEIRIGNTTAGTFVDGKLTTVSSAIGYASLNIPAGAAVPAAPVNGDMWTSANAAELFMRQKGSSNTLLGASAVTTEALVSDTSVTVLIGGVTYKLLARA